MTVLLPTWPMPVTAKPRYVEFGTRLTGPFGGTSQNVMRLGDRMALDVTMPPMKEVDARPWIAAHLEAKATGQPVRMRFPQLDGPTGAIGVFGPLNSNTATLNGAYSNVKPGMFFSSIDQNAFSFLHAVTTVLTGGAIRVSPRLRTNLNGPARFDMPMIEGWIETDFDWTIDIAQVIGLSFTVTERK